MNCRKILALHLFAILLPFLVVAQEDRQLDSIEAAFASTAPYFRHTALYVHLDKSIYVNNENIWFTSYLLHGTFSVEKYNTLHVFLSDRYTNKVVLSERFVMTGGIAAGNLFVPDSLRAGDYTFTAYANTFTEEPYPQPFRQQVNIRAASADPFTISFEKTGPAVTKGDTTSLMCRVVNKESLYAKNAKARYKILADDKIIATDSVIINQYGELPLKFLTPPNAHKFELITEITTGKISFATRISIPALTNRIHFNWYPEGGDLIDGIKGRVAFETTGAGGKPVAINGLLVENGQALGTIQTNAAGLGIVDFTPVADRAYSVRLNNNDTVGPQLNFPVIKSIGYSMMIPEGLVSDTMVIHLGSSRNDNKVSLLIHDYQHVIHLSSIEFKNRSVVVKIPTAEMPPGLVTITLLDADGKPSAERTVFNGYHQVPFLEITADSSQYHTRSKVTLKIRAFDSAGKPLLTSFSMASVYSKRVDTLNYQDIVPYSLFNNYAEQGLIKRPPMYELGSPAQIEMFLLTHCWTRYREPFPDTINANSFRDISLSLKGKVLPKRKNARLPVELAVMGGALEFINTDEEGHFELPLKATELRSDAKLQVFVNKKDKTGYDINFDQGAKLLEDRLARRLYTDPVLVKAALPEEEKALLTNIKTLTAAVVKSRSGNGYDTAVYVSRTCNDYVCMYNILNCKNHPYEGTRPVNGQYYIINGRMTLYKCEGVQQNDVLLYMVKGRYFSKDFYVADYAKFNPPEPELGSTVFWSPQIITDENGGASVSFYTNDLVGMFFCIAEGATGNGVISGKKLLRVVK